MATTATPKQVTEAVALAATTGLFAFSRGHWTSETTVRIVITHCPPPWADEGTAWTREYQGDPGGRMVIEIQAGSRVHGIGPWSFTVHCSTDCDGVRMPNLQRL